MRIVFNPSGTHIHKGFLKVRVDLYPESADKTYALHYVDHFDREPTEEELADEAKLALIPTHKEVNPCLCHFMVIAVDDTPDEILQMAKDLFDNDTVAQLDNFLSQPIIDLSGVRKLRTQPVKARVVSVDIDTINSKLVNI